MQAKNIKCPNCGLYRTRRVRDLRRFAVRPRRFIDLAFWPFRLPLQGRYALVKVGDDLKCIHCGHTWEHKD
jgi:exosome complex RNA-binding protein Csl4